MWGVYASVFRTIDWTQIVMKLADNCLVQFCHLSYRLQGRSQDFLKGGGVTEATHRCSLSCISGLSRIIAAWRPISTKGKSRWRKYFTKKKNLKSGLFNNGFYGQDIVMAFSPPEYCRLFAQKKAYQGGGGGVTGTPGPRLATPLDWNDFCVF